MLQNLIFLILSLGVFSMLGFCLYELQGILFHSPELCSHGSSGQWMRVSWMLKILCSVFYLYLKTVHWPQTTLSQSSVFFLHCVLIDFDLYYVTGCLCRQQIV
uniref:Uncharacterized protein n=1 Tax=Cacopsylla melanoneura TaxID=428564 RepID=A0A8D8PVP0_9HEMI